MAIEQLVDVPGEFPGVFFRIQGRFRLLLSEAFRDFGSGRQRTYCLPGLSHQLDLAKKMDVNLNQYLAAGLIQHSTSPHSSPVMVFPKKSGGVRITDNSKKLNDINKSSHLPIPRVN